MPPSGAARNGHRGAAVSSCGLASASRMNVEGTRWMRFAVALAALAVHAACGAADEEGGAGSADGAGAIGAGAVASSSSVGTSTGGGSSVGADGGGSGLGGAGGSGGDAP